MTCNTPARLTVRCVDSQTIRDSRNDDDYDRAHEDATASSCHLAEWCCSYRIDMKCVLLYIRKVDRLTKAVRGRHEMDVL